MNTAFNIFYYFLIEMFHDLKQFIVKQWVLDRTRYKLEFLEYELTAKGEWRSDIQTVVRILKCLDNKLLENVSIADANQITIVTGFKNTRHVLDWCGVVRNNLHNDIRLGEESLDLPNHRREVSLYRFLMHDGKLDGTIVGFKQQLLNMLENMQIELDCISNARIKEREASVINAAIRDVFSIVEGLVALGVANE